MKHKVSELEGALLDAAVAKAAGHRFELRRSFCWVEDEGGQWEPSRQWSHGGPIIEREQIELSYEPGWSARRGGADHWGSTPLIAAMRAYVSSKFGEEVDL